ncbi:MAG TPA: SUMF1/EgtB/PvdO family nonheme iron enzyme [Chthoniobacteraceae bacterium]|nr:SUMF1/EgtB/PvdO family nonheme iron enzyme [Chthoniobacteraceae bacterium]
MNKLIVCSVCLVLSGSLMAQDGNDAADKKSAPAIGPADAPAVQLVLELSDGARIIGAPSIDRLKMTTTYADLEILFSKLSMIEFSGTNHAAKAILQNGDSVDGRLAATEIVVKTTSGQVVTPLANVSKIRILAGSIFVNSLGMEFIAVPGMKGLFGIWDTRVQDYRAYAKANPGVDGRWKNPGFKQGEDHPVVMVSWRDATAFCLWLTQKERKEGKIGQDQEYRLPTDNEWSVAVGAGKYPWGNDWPPPRDGAGAGNYAPALAVDDFQNTSPVGSFKANQYGLYDMGGNVWQRCEDRVVRGASWYDYDPGRLLCSSRFNDAPDFRNDRDGFRCVLVSVSSLR